MIRPGIMLHPSINFIIIISRALGSKLPDCPVRAMFVIKEFDEFVERVSIGALRVGTTRSRRRDDL
jgi:hypothetical protein